MPSKKNEKEKYRIKWSKTAKKDLRAIVIFIAQNNPQTALKIHKRIKDKADTLDHFPFRGSLVLELLAMDIKNVRQLTEHPWRIIYKVDEINKIVNIITIVDSRRDLLDFLKQKFLSFDN